MRRSLPTLLALLTLAAPLAGQAKPGHVYGISFFQVLPGKGQAYNKAIAEISVPVLDEMVKRKAIVSYLALDQATGAGEYSHVYIVEFADWAALGAFPARQNEAAEAVLHKSWSEAIAGFPELRRFVRSESYRPAGQQP
ncbi:MAG TPA: hypothetical protein VEU55_04360 [Gemmatimonadales bacterium]|nr:hypothetical protein [Gemmatimonadales bacterium]